MNDAWLKSDGQIIGRVVKTAHKKGTQLALTLPDGVEVKAVVPKLNADSIIKYCEFVRGEYSERQAEQKAQKARASAEREMAADDAAAAADKPTVKEAMGLDYLDKEAVAARCLELARRETSARDTARACKIEAETLRRILKVLEDAQEDSAETPASKKRSKAQTETFKKLYPGEEE